MNGSAVPVEWSTRRAYVLEAKYELLKLVRPDLAPELNLIQMRPDIIGEVILRNRKATVTDMEGRFIFRGQQVQRIAVPVGHEIEAFVTALQDYLQHGYRASAGRGDAGRAIGFVMTIYRKLASSSIAAITRALVPRDEEAEAEAEAKVTAKF